MKITIKHDTLGEITIHDKIPNEIMERVGTIVPDFSKIPTFYYADIIENEGGTFTIINLGQVKPETVNIGMKKYVGGSKSFITVITNKWNLSKLVVYPSGIVSVNYSDQ